MYSIEELTKHSKWTDDIKKDTKYFGYGTVNNQTHLQNGHRVDHPLEDRTFSYELKENHVFAYGILDGYNGTWTVDLLEQSLLTNMYFDNLNQLQEMNDEEVYTILKEEFNKAEQTLEENIKDLLMKRATLTLDNENYRRDTREHLDNVKEIRNIDNQIKSGAFAVVSLVIDDRLFIANVGTSHCFLCFYDMKTNEKSLVSLETVHNLSNFAELDRLAKLNARVSFSSADSDANEPHSLIKYTRCMGDFKLKLYYDELPQFQFCTGPPLICEAENPENTLRIDNSFLFLAMYSDGFAKALEKTHLKSENTCATIARMLIQKIISEQTLNSAAQSVLDEVKRAFDDKFVNSHSEREDFTLAVRVFDTNIKSKLVQLENLHSANQTRSLYSTSEVTFRPVSVDELTETYGSYEDDACSNSSISTIATNSTPLNASSAGGEKKVLRRQEKPINELVDENDQVKPYVELCLIEKLVELPENKELFDKFVQELSDLGLDTIEEAMTPTNETITRF